MGANNCIPKTKATQSINLQLRLKYLDIAGIQILAVIKTQY